MQRIFSALGQALSKSILIVSLIGLLSLSNLSIFSSQPAYAATRVTTSPKIDYSQAAEVREESYEEAVEEAKNPEKMEEVYEENVKEYKETQPDKGGLIEEAKELVEKVTGK
jgi:hypothetical protein